MMTLVMVVGTPNQRRSQISACRQRRRTKVLGRSSFADGPPRERRKLRRSRGPRRTGAALGVVLVAAADLRLGRAAVRGAMVAEATIARSGQTT